MNEISVLIVVDVEAALAQGLQNHVYLVDTTGYEGGGGEGTNELTTVCSPGQTINWSVSPVAPDTSVTIAGFAGQIINDNVCNPSKVQTPSGTYWQGIVSSTASLGTVQYTVNLTMDGQTRTFDPFLKLVSPS